MGVILVFFYHFAYLSCFYDLGARKKADTIQSQIYMNGSVLSQEMVRTFFKEKLNSSADLGTYHVCCVLSFLKVVIAWHYVSENPLLSSQFLGLQGPSILHALTQTQSSWHQDAHPQSSSKAFDWQWACSSNILVQRKPWNNFRMSWNHC